MRSTTPRRGRALASALLVLVPVLALGACGEDEPADPEAPVTVEVGKEFSWNGFTVPSGWEYDTITEQVALEEQTHPLVRAKVVNDGDEARSALFEFVFVAEGDVLATVRCNSTEELAADQEGDLFCPGYGQPVPDGYDKVVVQPVTRS
ncbi:hypothetical protein [Nocardioides sp. P5_C9_2]